MKEGSEGGLVKNYNLAYVKETRTAEFLYQKSQKFSFIVIIIVSFRILGIFCINSLKIQFNLQIYGYAFHQKDGTKNMSK